MGNMREAITERRQYLFSVLITALAMAFGINLLASWFASYSGGSMVMAVGIASVLVALVSSYLGIGWPVSGLASRMRLGVFIEPTSPASVRIVSHKHYSWAEPEWLEGWTSSSTLASLLPKWNKISSIEKDRLAEFVNHLVTAKICALSEAWSAQDRNSRAHQSLVAPGVDRTLITPLPMKRTANKRDGECVLTLSSWLGTCSIVVRPTEPAIQLVDVTSVFRFARSANAPMGNEASLYAVGAELECSFRVNRLAWYSRDMDIVARWFTYIVENLQAECSYRSSMDRLQQLVIFELFRQTHSDVDSRATAKGQVIPLHQGNDPER